MGLIPTVATSPVVDALRLLTTGIPDVQQALDQDWREAIQQAGKLWQQADAAGLGSLARAMSPSRLVVQDILLEIQMAIQKSRESVFTLNVRPLNVSYHRRYGASSYAAVQLQVSVRQLPAQPRTPTKQIK